MALKCVTGSETDMSGKYRQLSANTHTASPRVNNSPIDFWQLDQILSNEPPLHLADYVSLRVSMHRPLDLDSFRMFASRHGSTIGTLTLTTCNASALIGLDVMPGLVQAIRKYWPNLQELSLPLCLNERDETACCDLLDGEIGSGSLRTLKLVRGRLPLRCMFNLLRLFGSLMRADGSIENISAAQQGYWRHIAG